MIKIGICDDNKKITEKISSILKEYKGKEFNIDVFNSGEELLESRKHFDILFLDIDMGGINGIETGKRIREKDKNLKIIYLTSYSNYAHMAFSVHAFAYLLKPVKKEEIYHQIDEALSYYQKEDDDFSIEFSTNQGLVKFLVSDIYYFEYQNRTVKIVSKIGEYIIKEKISSIYNIMKNYDFTMPHKSFIVNFFNVKTVKGYDITMINESIVPLSQKKSTEFRDALNEFLQNRIMNF